MSAIKKLNLNFNFHWTFFRERNVLPKKDLSFRIVQIFVAEFLGTLILVFWGCNTLGQINSGEPVVTCWLWGNMVFLAITIIGPISNCHINPAVTVSFFIYGYVSVVVGIVYIIAQLLGAIAGYILLMAFGTDDFLDPFGYERSDDFCVNKINTDTPFRAMVLEGVGTALLCFLIGRVCNPLNPKGLTSISFIFSFAIMILAFTLGPITSASVNPARSFGPAVVTGQFKDHWVFWVGPILGALVSSFTYHIFFLPKVNYIDDGTVEAAD
ncbi:unnamed protein product [Nezara viridula]|uniref:Aquaporin n=1 Tax=Nezara viridula TaxID=85310 RepID=A0A9P0HLJ3_NEZVI|nr:unnamed protein product [Nezara viridula]